MRPEMFLPFLVGYGLAVRQCRAELMATQSWLQDEVAKLRKELAAARAELHRLRAAQRDPDATLN
jgi:septal ring factor EnvC (AmiA/AmiB activator)